MTPTPRDEGMKVKRMRGAELHFTGNPFAEYVLASDFDALIRERDQLKANYQIAREAACRAGDYQREVTALEARVSTLLQERDKLKAERDECFDMVCKLLAAQPLAPNDLEWARNELAKRKTYPGGGVYAE